MSILTLDQIRTESLTKKQNIIFLKRSPTNDTLCFGNIFDLFSWNGMPIAGSNKTTLDATGSLFNNSSDGALNFKQPTTGNSLYLKDINIAGSLIFPEIAATGRYGASIGQGTIHIWDRLWMNGGLSKDTTYSFTQPSLTRYTDGDGLSLWFRLHSTAAQTIGHITGSVTYFNQSNLLKTTNFIFDSYNNINGVNQIFPVPLDSGCTGIRQLVSTRISGSTVASYSTVKYGFFIAKYYGAFKFNNITSFSNNSYNILNGSSKIDNSACLTLGLQIPGPIAENITATSNMPNISGNLVVIEG